MANDRTIVFGALAVHLALVTREQLARIAERVPDSELDLELVRSGYLTALDRQELWSEVDRLELEYDKDIARILKSIQGNPGSRTIDERHAATADSESASDESRSEAEKADDPEATVLARHEETVKKLEPLPIRLKPPKAGEKSRGTTSDLTDPNAESNPFEETLVSNDRAGLLNTVDRKAETPAELSRDRETVDYEPETQSRYSLTRVHGEGGLGQVWLATDPALNREIALKRIRPGKNQNRDAQLRLIKEAQITGQLEHPNIIPVYELEQYDEKGRPFYTMKFLRGDTLNDRIKAYHRNKKKGQNDPLELIALLNSFIDICNAIAYAAARGIVHRDLKPQNVMIGDFGEVIVLDWGLAKLIESREDDSSRKELRLGELADATETAAGQVVGSPAYMAPEQAAAQNDQVDARTDVYGLGAMLFTILAGQPPHRGTKTGNTAQDTIDLLNRISTGRTPLLREIDPAIPRPLEAICARAMHKGARHRYQDARDLAEDVQRYLADEPVSVMKDTRLQKTGRWLRRHRAWTQSIATAVILISVVSVFSAIVVNGARNREVAARGEAVEHFRQARRTIDESLIELSDILEEYPAVEAVRTGLLKKAAAEYQALAEQKSDQPELQLEMSRALVRLARVRQLLEDFEGAVNAYDQALAALGPIAEADAASSEIQAEVVTCLNGLGICWSTLAPRPKSGEDAESLEKAESCYAQATKLVNLALKSDPENTELLRLRARTFANLGVLLATTPRLGLSEENSTRAIEEFLKLAENPGETKDIESLAKARVALARLLIQQGKSQQGISTLKDALKSFRRLVNSDESSTTFLAGLADSRLTLANAMHSLGNPGSQLNYYEESAADYLDLIQARPDVPRFRSSLVTALTNVAQILYRLGDGEPAIEHLATALQQVEALADSPRKVEQECYVRVTFGQVLRDGGDFVNTQLAFETADELCAELVEYRPDFGAYRVLHGEIKNNIGIFYLLTGDPESALAAFRSARSDFDRALELNRDDVAACHGRAWCLNYLADTLYGLSRKDEAATHYADALRARSELCRKDPQNIEFQYALAWLLLNGLDPGIRDIDAGVRIADRLSRADPENGRLLVLQAFGQLRAKNDFAVITSLDRAARYGLSRKTPAEFIRAMALWNSQDQAGAIAAWKTADAARKKVAPGDIKLRRLQAESAALLQIPGEKQIPAGESMPPGNPNDDDSN